LCQNPRGGKEWALEETAAGKKGATKEGNMAKKPACKEPRRRMGAPKKLRKKKMWPLQGTRVRRVDDNPEGEVYVYTPKSPKNNLPW